MKQRRLALKTYERLSHTREYTLHTKRPLSQNETNAFFAVIDDGLVIDLPTGHIHIADPVTTQFGPVTALEHQRPFVAAMPMLGHRNTALCTQ